MSDAGGIWRIFRYQRPPLVHLALFCGAFILAAGFGQWLAIIPGIAITLWPPNGVYIATLLLNRRVAWPYFIVAALLAELTCNSLWFHNEIAFAVAYNAANAIESVVAALLLGRFFSEPARFRTLRQVIAFIIIGVACAPLIGATIGSTIDALIGKHAFGTAWLLWYVGDATGVLIAAPLVLVLAEIWRSPPRLSGRVIGEAAAISIILLGFGTWTLAGHLPFAYILLPLILWAAVRFEFRGAALASAFLALLVASTARTQSQFEGDAESQAQLHIMMQLFLAVSALIGLVVASTSRQRRKALEILQDANEELEQRVDERTAELRDSKSFVESVLATAPHAVYIFDIVERQLVYRSRDVGAELGYSAEEMREIGPNFLQRILHPEDRQRLDQLLNRWRSAGDDDVLETVIRHCRKDGTIVWRLNREKAFRRSADGAIRQIVGASLDITERKLAEDRERLLMLEVNHRAKNMLAVVQAIARQTSAHDLAEFAERFSRRIASLSASQDLLVRSGWRKIPLDELVRMQLAPVADGQSDRVEIRGPELRVTAAAAQTIGMALHELATNAAKYGCLSADGGHIAVEWDASTAEHPNGGDFTMRWRESGGPPVTPPEHQGFGSNVIDKMVKMSLDAEVTLDYAPQGLTWQIVCPLRKLTGDVTNERGSVRCAERPSRDAIMRRVLVVEDEPLIALEISTALSEAGFAVVGPASSVAKALDLIKQAGCDVAVLDINLGGETAEPVASALAGMDTPFVTISGYSPAQRPAGFTGAPHVGKPLNPDRLIAEIISSLNRAAAEPMNHRAQL